MNTYEIQSRLKELGYEPGPIDGIRGRRTIAAVKAFQRDTGLLVDGIVGTNTRAALARNAIDMTPSPGSPPWFEIAGSLLGTREVPRRGDNPVIMGWAEELDIDYAGDDVPWCGLFVAHCIATALPDEVIPANPLWARGWRAFGRQTDPRIGAILVFWRGKRDGWTGHVGFYAGETGTHYVVRGGNQSDKVSDMRILKDRLLEARWPVTSPDTGDASRVVLSCELPAISNNEA